MTVYGLMDFSKSLNIPITHSPNSDKWLMKPKLARCCDQNNKAVLFRQQHNPKFCAVHELHNERVHHLIYSVVKDDPRRHSMLLVVLQRSRSVSAAGVTRRRPGWSRTSKLSSATTWRRRDASHRINTAAAAPQTQCVRDMCIHVHYMYVHALDQQL